MSALSRRPLVLLLAGDELTRRISTSCLEAFDYEVVSARTAEEAERLLISLHAARRIDVLVTDADVRDAVDGLSLATVARCLDPTISVIYTARLPYRIPEARKVSGAPCLRTPYHGHQLVGLIGGLRLPAAGSRAAA